MHTDNYCNVEIYCPFYNCPKIIKTPLTKALQEGNEDKAKTILENMEKDGLELNVHEFWQMKAYKNLDFDEKDFLSLSPEIQNLVYRTANSFNNIYFVKCLNAVWPHTAVNRIRGPAILSPFMDVASSHQRILEFLNSLRCENTLLTKAEMADLQNEQVWIEKDDFNRLLGNLHIDRLIKKLNLKHIKVPIKKAVIESETDTLLSFTIRPPCKNRPYGELLSKQFKIYAQLINSTFRFFTRVEIEELICIIEAANYTDLVSKNIIITEDDIYLIDNEFMSFNGEINWDEMKVNFKKYISNNDLAWFEELISKKIEEQEQAELEETFTYGQAKYYWRGYKKDIQAGGKQNDVGENCKQLFKQYKFMGYTPCMPFTTKNRVYSFPIQGILAMNPGTQEKPTVHGDNRL